MIPDTVFIVAGVVPLVAASIYGLLHLRPVRKPAEVEVWVPDREEPEIFAVPDVAKNSAAPQFGD